YSFLPHLDDAAAEFVVFGPDTFGEHHLSELLRADRFTADAHLFHRLRPARREFLLMLPRLPPYPRPTLGRCFLHRRLHHTLAQVSQLLLHLSQPLFQFLECRCHETFSSFSPHACRSGSIVTQHEAACNSALHRRETRSPKG